MASYAGKGKSTDRSTGWSANEWDETRQQWYTRRRDHRGDWELWYHQAETGFANTAEDNSSMVPRTFPAEEPGQSQTQPSYSSAVVSTAAKTQVATNTHNIPTAGDSLYSSGSRYTTGVNSAYTTSDPYGPSAASGYLNTTSSRGANSPPQFGTAPTADADVAPTTWNSYNSSNNTGYHSRDLPESSSAAYYYGGYTADGIASGMESLGLTTHAATEEQGNEEQKYSHQKYIRREPGSNDYEKLDPRFRIVKDQRAFWKVGRVFMVLWTEPAEPRVGPEGGTRNGSHFSVTWLNSTAYSEIRRFVVVRVGYGSSICSPIHTYSGRATLKPNLPEQQQHTIIHTSDSPPEECSYTAEDGTLVKENFSKDPIKVKREQQDSEGHLDPSSRLNYSKTYTVEHNLRVLNIGMVHRNSLQSLEANSILRPPTAPPGRPIRHPLPANSERRDSRDTKHDGKSRGSSKKGEHGGDRRRHK